VVSTMDPHGHILGFLDWKHDMNNKLNFIFVGCILLHYLHTLYENIIYTIYISNPQSNFFYSSVTSLHVSAPTGHHQLKKCININFVFVKDHQATLNTCICINICNNGCIKCSAMIFHKNKIDVNTFFHLKIKKSCDCRLHIYIVYIIYVHTVNNLKFTSSTGDIHSVLKFLLHKCKFCITAAPFSRCNT
jgi:hypothetical protein